LNVEPFDRKSSGEVPYGLLMDFAALVFVERPSIQWALFFGISI
jgi:hypothetical protein